MKSEDIVALIYKKYEGNSHVVFEQVPDGTGGFQNRWIDVAVFSLWPSKGLTRSAFEVKVSRSDFIAELQNPLKHKWAQESFHEFWFVAPLDIVKLDELPTGAGFMYPRGNKLCIKKHCVRNGKPKLDDVLLAGFMRSAWKSIENNKKVQEKQIIEGNKDFKRYKLFSEAVCQFCESRGIYGFLGDETKEFILQKLEAATLDEGVAAERIQVLHVLDSFQRDIVGLFQLFAVLANRSLLAKDEAGNYIVNAYGGNHDDVILSLKSRSKGDDQRRYEELVNLILNWHNLPNAIVKIDHK